MKRAEGACLVTWLAGIVLGLAYHLSWLLVLWGAFWAGWWFSCYRLAVVEAEGAQKALDQILRARMGWYPPVSERHTFQPTDSKSDM